MGLHQKAHSQLKNQKPQHDMHSDLQSNERLLLFGTFCKKSDIAVRRSPAAFATLSVWSTCVTSKSPGSKVEFGAVDADELVAASIVTGTWDSTDI